MNIVAGVKDVTHEVDSVSVASLILVVTTDIATNAEHA